MVGRFCRQIVFPIHRMVNRLVYHARNQTNYAVVKQFLLYFQLLLEAHSNPAYFYQQILDTYTF